MRCPLDRGFEMNSRGVVLEECAGVQVEERRGIRLKEGVQLALRLTQDGAKFGLYVVVVYIGQVVGEYQVDFQCRHPGTVPALENSTGWEICVADGGVADLDIYVTNDNQGLGGVAFVNRDTAEEYIVTFLDVA
ncbi:MAG: hypothetical protein WAZ14_03705 [Patescibacteria group bacterium]